MIHFDLGRISSIEFGVCRDAEGHDRHVLVPINDSVREALESMLRETINRMWAGEDAPHMAPYEPSQKYGPTESLTLAIDSELCEGPRALFASNNIVTQPEAVADPASLEHYFAIYHDADGDRIVGVRRATQFKGIVGAKGRLLSMFDQTLGLLPDTVFKLDTDFDYLITAETVYILHPSGFEYTAEIDDHILAHAAQTAQALAQTVPCINFQRLTQFVATHKRAARLLASLRTRADLAQTSLEKLRVLCEETETTCEETGGRIGPAEGHEMAFLMLLDRRRYALSLVEGVDELYEAPNRRGVRGQATR